MTATGPAAAALAGRRIVELAGEPGMYCGKLFADMGADVITVERPGGDPARAIPPFAGDAPDASGGLPFRYLNTSKRSVVLDLDTDRARLRALVATADAVVESFPPGFLGDRGLGYAALAADHPALVVTSITGFGQTGPHRDWLSSDLVASALGGAMQVIGYAADPPVALAGAQAYVMGSVMAACGTMLALLHAARTGRGQHVDVSLEETMASVTHITGVGKWLDDGIVPRRGGPGLFASVPSGAYACRDGLVYLMVNRPAHWQALARWIHEATGVEEVLDPMFEGPSSNRLPYRELLDVYVTDLTSRRTVDEVYHEGQRRHIAFTPVHDAGAVVRDPHLAARGFFVEVTEADGARRRHPGAPYRHTATPWAIRRRAPLPGEHTAEVLGELDRSPRRAAAPAPAAPAQPLAGVRVVEFTAAMAGPWIGRFMAHAGAEVIRIESRTRPDVVRLYVPPRAPERGTQPTCSPWFTDWNAGKRFVALDLTVPRAVALAKRLVGIADVVIENYASGVMDKLGLGYAALRTVRPDLVMLSTSGYGDHGPHHRYVTWGPNIEALSGLATLSGLPGRACTTTQFAYPDAASALHGLFAVLAALDHRRRTGTGQAIGLAQLEATIAAIGSVMMEPLASDREPPRLGNRARHAAPHGCYPCRGEDRWCAITVFGDEEWRRLCAATGHAEWARDPHFATAAARLAHTDALDRLLETWTAARDPYDVMRTLQAARVPAGVVQTTEDQRHRDPQLAARGFFEEIEHLTMGTVVATGIPLGLTATPGRSGRTGAAVGQDNHYVFGELLGMPAAEIQECIDLGAIEAADV